MSPQDSCDLCGMSEENATTRELQRSEDGGVVAHYYCMLYSPMVTEKDSQEDSEGFAFNIESVLSEIERGQRLRCSVCKRRGATVGCDVRSCKKTYHYPCLIRAKGRPSPHKFVVYCAKHKYSKTTNDSERLKRRKKRRRLVPIKRNNNIRNLHDDDNDSEHQQRHRRRTRLQNTAGGARMNNIRNLHDNNGHPHTTVIQNVQICDQPETTFLLAIHSAVEIEDSEEALPSTSGQPMSSDTSSEESDSILCPKVKDSFSLSGFPKRNKKSSSNRRPNEKDSPKLQEILQNMSSQEKKDLSQIYSELGGSEPNLTTGMDAAWDNRNSEITTEDAMNSNVTETSTFSDNSDRDKTPERLPAINVHGIPSRYSTEKKHFTKEQPVSSQDEKVPDKVSKSVSRKKILTNVISMLSRISDRSGKGLRAQGTSQTHPSGHSSMTEPESILCSPLTTENDGSKAEVSTSVSDASLENMDNDLSTSQLSSGEIFPEKKTHTKRTISDIASPQQITAISRKLGTLTGQFRSIVPQIQSAINSPRKKAAKNTEQSKDGQTISKGSSKPNTNDRTREVIELRRLRSSLGWIEKKRESKRLRSINWIPVENNLLEPLRNRGTSDNPIKKRDSVCVEKRESITSKRKRFQDREELLPNILTKQTEVKLPGQQESPENQDDCNSTEDSLLEETETSESVMYEQTWEHQSGPSEMTTPVRRRLNSLYPSGISQTSFAHESTEDLDGMDGFGRAVAGQCRLLPEDRQAKYMSYVLASADLFRAPPVLPEVDVLITNLRTVLDRFQHSSACSAYGSSD